MKKRRLKFEKKERPGKEWNREKIIMVAAIVFILINLALFFCQYRSRTDVVEMKDFGMRLEVTNKMRLTTDNTSLNFGGAFPGVRGTAITRSVFLESDEPVYVEIILSGNLARWVIVSDNYFVFEGSKKVDFTANIPPSALPGIYKGRALIIFRKPPQN